MKQLNLNKILAMLTEVCWLAIIFLIPLYFAYFFKTNDVFELNKIVLFRVLVLLMLEFTVIKAILARRQRLRFKNIIKPWQLLILILYLISLIVATVISLDPSTSFHGLYSRWQGLETQFYYLSFFVLLIVNLNSRTQIKRIIIAAIAATGLVSLYGLVQISGYDFANWTEPTSQTGRVNSSLGQPNFLAAYLLLAMPLTIYGLVKVKVNLLKFILALTLLFQLINLFSTYSRSGWLGLSGGLMALALIYFLVKPSGDKINFAGFKKFNLITIAFILLAVICLSLLFINGRVFFLSRIKSSFDFTSGSLAARINFWQASLQAIRQKPLFGYGLENQQLVFARHYQADWARNGAVNVYPNRAHNFIFDILLTGGLVGLIAYLALLYLFYKLIINNISTGPDKLLAAMVFFGLTSYLISLLFGFTIVATNIYFWLYFALILAARRLNLNPGPADDQPGAASLPETDEQTRTKAGLIISKAKLARSSLILLIILASLALVGRQLNREVKKITADYYFLKLVEASQLRDISKAWGLYNYIIEDGSRENYYDRYFGQVLADWSERQDSQEMKRLAAVKLNEIANKLTEHRHSNLLVRARIYTALASQERPEYFELAQENFSRAIILAPELAENYRELAKFYLKRAKITSQAGLDQSASQAEIEYQPAIANFQQALALIPDPASDKNLERPKRFIKYERYLNYLGLGNVYLPLQQYDQAELYYRLALGNNHDDVTLYKKIADTYYLRGDLDQAIWYNKIGFNHQPTSYGWPLAISLLYQESGDLALAEEYGEIAEALRQ